MKTEMKKTLFMVAAVALAAAVSCNKEGLGDNGEGQAPSSIVFTAGVETKTTLVDNGDKTYSINWNNGDAITVDGVTFTTLSEGAKADFSTESAFSEDNDYEAIYPATAGTSFASVTVPASQVAVAGNFCSSAAVSVAKSTTTSLDFKNVTSFLKFQVSANATKVTISSSSPLAGEVSVDYNNGEPTWTAKNTVNTLTVTCDGGFKTGVDYYVSVLPGEKTNFEVRLDGYLSMNATSVTAKRSIVMNMKTLPAPVASDVKVKVGSAQYTTYVEGDYSVLRNVQLSSTYTYKIVDANSNELRGVASTTPLNSWCYLYKAANSMSGLNGTFDIYVYKSKSSFCIVNTGEAVPQYDSTNQTFYFMYQDTNWWGLYAWNGSDYLLGPWEDCGANRLGVFTTPGNKECSYWALPARANNKTINVIVRNSGAGKQTVDTSIKLTGDTESWFDSWDGDKAVIGTYVLVPHEF